MKKINLLIGLFMVVTFFGCNDREDTSDNTYDPVNGQTLVSFNQTSSDLPVVIDGTGSVDVRIDVSSVSTSDRTVTVSIDPESTADAENYTVVNPVVTIPAGEHLGYVTIDGIDNSVEIDSKTIILDIESTSVESVLGTTTHTVNMFQVCPVPEDFFTGSYLIEQVSPQIDGYSLSHGSVVQVTASGPTQRSFQTEAYITYCPGTFFTFRINLVCNYLVVPSNRTTCACGNFDDWWGPAVDPLEYDLTDDTEILVRFTDDAQGDCGSPAQTVYRFTKQ